MKVTVKWTSKKLELDLDVSESPIIFKNQLWSLTGVAPGRQKLLLRGVQIKDDTDWSTVKNLQEGAQFMMLGTAGELPKAPDEKPVFVEDLSKNQAAQIMANAPPGLVNLENTCYLNATLQCLRQVTELQSALQADGKSFSGDAVTNIAVSLRELYKQLEKPATVDAIPPVVFLTNFRAAYPQFAQQDNRGHYAQQDAEEAWNQLLTAISSSFGSNGKSPVTRYMGIELEHETTCDDPAAAAAGEMATTTETTDLRLTCHISNTTNNVHQSLVEGMTQHLEKASAALGREAKYTVQSKIKRLPKYLTVHFARFFWRADIKQRVKIRRNVAYPSELDMYQYCTKDLQSKLSEARNHGRVHPDLAADDGCNPSGVYELCAVLTHIGASSDSGHYIGWVKKEKDDWHKFDDDKVSPIKEAEVLKNSGSSADGHIAYLLLYRAKDVEAKPAPSSSLSNA
ncbi:deubiquitinating enzyme [Allomyces javanicus]|nr:deubiquitinating enzyme [Allomyces javanicus]